MRLGRLLGRGAFGAVYASTVRGKPCAVKVLSLPGHTPAAGDAASESDEALLAAEDFLEEARLHQRLRHPNILAVVGVIAPPDSAQSSAGSEASAATTRHGPALVKLRVPTASPHRADGICAIVTELCEGGSLWDQLHCLPATPDAPEQLCAAPSLPRGPLSERVVSQLGAQVAAGLEYLHGLSPPVLHRDLKSPNILLTAPLPAGAAASEADDLLPRADASADACRLVLADFGLARAKARLVGSATMTVGLGTLQWTAPEVLTGERYSEKADVFGLAVVLWELLCRGEVPWAGRAPGAIAVAVSTGKRPPLPRRCPRLEAVLERCWSHKPELRPTAAEARTMLLALAR